MPRSRGSTSTRRSPARGAFLLVAVLALAATGCAEDPEPTFVPVEAPLTTSEQAQVDQALELLRGGLPEQVEATLGPLLERDPVPVGAQYAAGQAAYGLARYDEAARRLADVVARDPGQLPGCTSLGFAHYKLGDFDSARQVFAAILALDPDSVKALYGLGQVELTLGQAEAARPHLERALELDPDHLKARYALARVHQAGGRLEQALAEVTTVVERWPSHEEALYVQASVLSALGRTAEAEAALARRAQVYETKESLGTLERRLRSGEDSALLRLQIVRVFLELGDEAEALRALRAGLAAWPEDPVLRELWLRLTETD